MDDMKKENFDLKLRVYHLEDRLRQLAPSNIDNVLKEVWFFLFDIFSNFNFFLQKEELKVQNEALMAEIKAHQEIISEAHTAIEQYRQQATSRPAAEAEIQRLRQEVDQATQQLSRAQTQCQKYESQLALFDKESREYILQMILFDSIMYLV